MDTCDIVSDAEIDRVHFGDFGDQSKRDVVDEGVLQYAFGFTTGYTMLTILIKHGLVRKPQGGKYKTILTVKGKRYLHAMFEYPIISNILALRKPTPNPERKQQ